MTIRAYTSDHVRAMLPRDVWIVACLFLIYGAWALYDMVVGFASGRPSVNFGAVCLLIGPGLLARSEVARICAIAVTVVLLVFTLDGVAHFVADQPDWISVPLFSRVFGRIGGVWSVWYVSLASAGFIVLNLWQACVLMRGDVRGKFGAPTNPS